MTLADVDRVLGADKVGTCTGADKGGSCNKRIVYARSLKTGRPIPLDPSAPLYRVFVQDGFVVCEPLDQSNRHRVDDDLLMVSHFSTCKDADLFHRKGGL
jgi:hypothetical protein